MTMTRPALTPRPRHPVLRVAGHALALLLIGGLWSLLLLTALHTIAWAITR